MRKTARPFGAIFSGLTLIAGSALVLSSFLQPAPASAFPLVHPLTPSLTAPMPAPAKTANDGMGQIIEIPLVDENSNATPVGLSGAPQAVAEANRIGREFHYDLVTVPLEVPNFLTLALTWDKKQSALDPLIEVRVHNRAGWGQWWSIEGDEAPTSYQKLSGTETFIAGASNAVQVRVKTTNHILPRDLQLVLYPDPKNTPVPAASKPVGTTDPAVEETPTQTVTASRGTSLPIAIANAIAPATPTKTLMQAATPARLNNQQAAIQNPLIKTGILKTVTPTDLPPALFTREAAKPEIISRAGWGADESLLRKGTDYYWEPEYYPIEAVVIHHSAGRNDYTPDESADIVKSIYRYHTLRRGWGDIGYNFLVDRFGRIFEGRNGTLAAPAGQMVEAGHAYGRNEKTMGIAVLGNFSQEQPPVEAVNAVAAVAGWELGRAGKSSLDMTSGVTYLNPRPGHKVGDPLPRVVGHRDVNNTSCPGLLEDHLQEIREKAAIYQRMPYTDGKNINKFAGVGLERLGGADRVATAVAAYDRVKPNSNYAIIVGYLGPMDALSVVPLADRLNAPVFYTKPAFLSPEVEKRLAQMKPRHVYVIGGEGVVGNPVVQKLESMGIHVDRLGGANRYETAVAVAVETMAIYHYVGSPATKLSQGLLGDNALKVLSQYDDAARSAQKTVAAAAQKYRQAVLNVTKRLGNAAQQAQYEKQILPLLDSVSKNNNDLSNLQKAVKALRSNVSVTVKSWDNEINRLKNIRAQLQKKKPAAPKPVPGKPGAKPVAAPMTVAQLTDRINLLWAASVELKKADNQLAAIESSLETPVQNRAKATAMLQAQKAQVARYGGSSGIKNALEQGQKDAQTIFKLSADTPTFVTTGDVFADALSAGPAAASLGGVVVLTRDGKIPSASAQMLASTTSPLYAIGGPAVRALTNSASLSTRVAKTVTGGDRYIVAANTAHTFFPHAKHFAIASGMVEADAVIASAFVANLDGGVLLTKRDRLPQPVAAEIATGAEKTSHLWVLGGSGVVNDTVMKSVDAVLHQASPYGQ